jgi:hypothetical protein
MSFFSAIAAFKGAFLGALLGGYLPREGTAPALQQRPGGEAHRPHPTRPGYGRPHPTRPACATPHHPHTHPISHPQLPSRPLFALFNR